MKVVIVVQDIEHTLTMEEAQRLHKELDRLFNNAKEQRPISNRALPRDVGV